MAISGLGFGTYLAVDLALVADVLPDAADSARDLGLFNIANALPYAWLRLSRPSSSRPAATATPSSTPSPGPAPSWRPLRWFRSAACADATLHPLHHLVHHLW